MIGGYIDHYPLMGGAADVGDGGGGGSLSGDERDLEGNGYNSFGTSPSLDGFAAEQKDESTSSNDSDSSTQTIKKPVAVPISTVNNTEAEQSKPSEHPISSIFGEQLDIILPTSKTTSTSSTSILGLDTSSLTKDPVQPLVSTAATTGVQI